MPLPDEKLLQLLETVSRVDERTVAIQDTQKEHQQLVQKWILDTASTVDQLTDRIAVIEQVHVQEAARKEALRGRASWMAKLGGALSAIATATYGVLKAMGVLA